MPSVTALPVIPMMSLPVVPLVMSESVPLPPLSLTVAVNEPLLWKLML